MLNQVIIVGRLVEKPIIEENENGKKVCNITLAVPRSYKNENGEYDTDFIKCTLCGGIAENTVEYCDKGDLVGVKGRLETSVYEKENGEKYRITSVVAEKLSFLSTNKTKEE